MFNNEPALILAGAILLLMAAAMSVFIGAEVVRIVRDFFAQLGGSRGAESEASPQISAQQAATRRNRATVERLITKFEERETPPASPPNE